MALSHIKKLDSMPDGGRLPNVVVPIPRGWHIGVQISEIFCFVNRFRVFCVFMSHLVVSRFFRTLVCKLWHEWSQPAMEASSMAASRCFIFMYFLLPHWEPATWRSRAQTSIRAELPSGKLPTTRVRRRISRFSLSMTLLVRMHHW